MSAPRSEPSVEAEHQAEVRAVGRIEVFGTVFVTGAAVMIVEVVGTRLIGPVFGVGLFVWAALLAVTLASLAAGYYAGGFLADQRLEPRLLGKAVTAAGLALALVPLLHPWVLGLAEGLGVRAGPLCAALMLFAPSLVALGATGPISVRLATANLATAGRGVGGVYAVSTAGSLLGTLLVAFVLIPALDAKVILSLTAAALILLGGVSLARRGQGAALGLLLVPLFVGEGSRVALPAGLKVLDTSHSLLGLVEVVSDDNRGVRFLRSDHSVLGASYERGGSSAFGFVDVLAAVRFLRPEAKSCLNIGLGTGAVPSALQRRGIRVDVVEIDPAVVDFARRYFGFSPNGEVAVEDARAFLRRSERRYDLVVHDTFTGGTTPEHLLSREVLERIRAMLTPGGVLALNFAGYFVGPDAEASFAVARTLQAIFPHVRAYRDDPSAAPESVGNLVFFASQAPLTFASTAGAEFDSERMEQFVKASDTWAVLQQVPPGPVITDARNPLARLQLPVAERHFAAMNELLPVALWLN